MSTASRLRTLGLVLVLLVPVAGVHADLTLDVDRLVRTAGMGPATVAVSIRDAGPGTELYERDGATPLIPASNLKLLTTGAALHELGADFRFETTLRFDGRTLTVVGDGDPAFGDPHLLAQMTRDGVNPLDVEGFVQLWVDAIAARAPRPIETLVIDDRVFDRELIHPSWPRDQLNSGYCAEVGGLNFHLNQIWYYPTPRVDDVPSSSLHAPALPVEFSNKATSRRGPSESNTAWIARKFQTNRMTMYGNVKHAYRQPVRVTVHDMPMLFGTYLARRLRRAGVTVGDVRLAAPDDAVPGGVIPGTTVATPISTVLQRTNTDSQNLYAEALLKRLGHARTGQPGSWLNGAPVIRTIIHERLDYSAGVVIHDGSGLSKDNRVTASTLSAWLNDFHNDARLGALFLDSLAVGGATGTLENRLGPETVHGARVNAKSGYVNGVSCLSGYVTSTDGRRRCFSILINGLTKPVGEAKALQNRIVAAIAEDLAPVPVGLGSDR